MLAGTVTHTRTWRAMAILALLLSIALTGGSALAGVAIQNLPAGQANQGAGAPGQPAQKQDPNAAPFDCSRIAQLGIAKQMNFRAAKILADCSGTKDGKAPGSGSGGKGRGDRTSDLDYGATDQNVVLPDGTYPSVTQSESFVWAQGSTVVVNYNDSRAAPGCYAGISYSTNGGATWTRVGGAGASPLCTGHGTNYGDPTVIYNAALGTWFASDLATGCGGQGIGVWTSPDGITWSVGACAHNGTSDDRQSHWVDNNPASPFYGRQYISWNDFAAGQGIRVVYSDNGTLWNGPVNLTVGFVRNVQMTGGSDGTVFVAGMDEGGGGFGSRTNIMYRSTNGGVSWTAITMGAAFAPPGDVLCFTNSYFVNVNPIWRHMGWGQPGVGPGGVVHYAYAGDGPGADTGDIFYTRSNDNGSTWSAPITLNTDASGRTQWMPSLAVTAGGAVEVSWYDRRNTTNDDYEWYGRVSLDNGATWQLDAPISDQIIPQPLQPDGNVQPCYAGDYNYHSAYGTDAYVTWTDGRVLMSGNSQQDVFFDKIPLIQGTPTPTFTGTPPTNTPTRTPTNTPTLTQTPCGPNGNYNVNSSTGAALVPGTTDIGNHCDDCTTLLALPFTYNLYGQPFSSVTVGSNGNLQFTGATAAYFNGCLPDATFNNTIYAYWDDLYTADTANGQGIFTSISGSAPNRIFNIEWRANFCCSVGVPVNDFEVRLYEGQGRFDIIYSQVPQSGTGSTVGVQRDTGSLFTQYECNTGGLTSGLQLTFTQPPCTTPTGTPPTATLTNTPTNTATRTSTPTFTLTRTPTRTNTPGTPDFTLSVAPSSRTVTRPNSTTYTVTLTSLAGFAGNVNLTLSGLPSKASGSFSPNPVALPANGTATSVLTITTQRGGPVGTFTLTVTGTSGTRTHSQTVTLVLNR